MDVPGIPAEAELLFKALLKERPLPADVLKREVSGYVQFVQHKASSNPEVDSVTAELLAGVSEKLLSLLTDDASDSDRRLIQASVRYFILEEDAEGDLVTQDGFADDVAVMNATVRALGLGHLAIFPE